MPQKGDCCYDKVGTVGESRSKVGKQKDIIIQYSKIVVFMYNWWPTSIPAISQGLRFLSNKDCISLFKKK